LSETSLLAIDLGAESGRAIVGHLGQTLRIEEVHRFTNVPVRVLDNLLWNVLGLWQQIKTGIAAACSREGAGLMSVGVDSWGVDSGLLAADDTLLGPLYHYRDRRTDGCTRLQCPS
jgi:sugar (pentulose or hexulose) kinase